MAQPSANVIAFAGSLRTGSLNRRLVAAMSRLAQPGLEITVFDNLAGIPLFNEDLEGAAPRGPGAVRQLRSLIVVADGVLIATPEYNQSLPGVMKNAVDWLSRPEGSAALEGKPVAIVGATTGPWGTRYAQKELRHTLTAAGAIVMPQPMLFLAHAATAFDADGSLSDPATRLRLVALLEVFRAWIALVTAAPQLMASSA